MSERENFLARWARRKREATEDAEGAKPSAVPVPPTVPAVPVESARAKQDEERPSAVSAGRSQAPDKVEPAFDLTRLPSIELITAETDIRAFLQPGVPTELTRAALRRAWSADPGIRNFVGLSENSWDFNNPDAMPGFGPLEMTDELRRQVMRMVGGGLEPATPDRPEPTVDTGGPSTIATETSPELVADGAIRRTDDVRGLGGTGQDEPVNTHDEKHRPQPPARPAQVDIAMQQSSPKAEDPEVIVRRTHGRALPE